ncbi:MAG: hypothetical protein WC359_13370 [Dehalococcoidia bacterium]|jgi:hypothetical protein
MKNKRTAILIILVLFALMLACTDTDGDTTTTTDTDESCWQRVYNECAADSNRSVWTCNDFANETCDN